MKLIQLPTIALEERIQEELEINPALEEAGEQEVEDPYESSDELNDNEEIPAEDINVDEYLSDDDIPDYRLKANNHSPDDEEKQIPLSGGETFMDHLLDQFGMRRLTERQRGLGEYLIGNIDDDGYIRRALIHIVDDLAFNQNVMTSEEELEQVLEVVQGLEPAGVGARDLRECPPFSWIGEANKPLLPSLRPSQKIISTHSPRSITARSWRRWRSMRKPSGLHSMRSLNSIPSPAAVSLAEAKPSPRPSPPTSTSS